MRILKSFAFFLLPKYAINQIKMRRYWKQFNLFSEKNLKESHVFKRFIRPNSSVLDLGANFGLFTKIFSVYTGKKGRVYSIEPIPLTYQILCHNIQRSNLGNVFPSQFAVCDSQGVAQMRIPSYHDQQGVSITGETYNGKALNYYSATLEGGEISYSETVDVELKTIDQFVKENSIDDISFIKCDVEGHELSAIIGAHETLKLYRPAMYIEISSDPRIASSKASTLFSFLIDLGYRAFIFSKEKNDIIPWTMNSDPEENYFFIVE